MRAFVLSGGGNFGPLQVGALRALLERGIVPELLVGCSAGALNASFLAREISLAQVEQLARVWRAVGQNDVYPGNRWLALGRLLCGQDSLYDNRNFYAFLQRQGVTPATEFGRYGQVPLRVTATSLHTGQLHVFGKNPHDRVLDALMASTALAPMHPPWEVDGELYVDGGTVTPLPVRVALEMGATEIYALDLVGTTVPRESRILRGVPALLRQSVMTTVRLAAQHDLAMARTRRQLRFHYIPLGMDNPPAPTDFSRQEEMFELGYAQTTAALQKAGRRVGAQPRPDGGWVGWSTGWWTGMRRRWEGRMALPALDAKLTLEGKEPH
jgi:NTE family protein